MSIRFRAWSNLRRALRDVEEPESQHTLADAYWRGLLSVAFTVSFLALGWGFLVSENVAATLHAPRQTAGHAASPLDVAKLNATVAGLSSRAEQYDALKAQRPQIADPSK